MGGLALEGCRHVGWGPPWKEPAGRHAWSLQIPQLSPLSTLKQYPRFPESN